jgi:hypothetical protein
MALADIHTEYKPYPICPYCGQEDRDAWEIDFDMGDTAESYCGQCGLTYQVTRYVSVDYSTKPTSEED